VKILASSILFIILSLQSFADPGSCLKRSHNFNHYLECLEKSIEFIPEGECAYTVNREAEQVKELAYGKFLQSSNKEEFSHYIKNGNKYTRRIFLIRQSLRERLQDYYANDQKVDRACVKAIRKATRYFRFAEELLSEVELFHDKNETFLSEDEVKKSRGIIARDLSIHPSQMIINPKYKDIVIEKYGEKILDIKSGDMFLVRSPSFVSATIARVGDDMGHFSHLAMAYVDEEGEILSDGYSRGEKGQVYIIEALIETGVIYWKFEDWVQAKTNKETGERYSEHSRMAMFRLKGDNQKYGKEMGKRIIQLAVQHKFIHDNKYKKKKKIKKLDYDFGMDMDNPNGLFCAELARFAACMGSNDLKEIYTSKRNKKDKYSSYKKYVNKECKEAYKNKSGLQLPTFPTTFSNFKGHPFLKAMGVKNNNTFSPVDLEVEPLVDQVLEWRNPLLTRETRASDAIYESIMQLMNQEGYWMDPRFGHSFQSSIAYWGRRLFDFKDENIRLSMPKGFLRTFIVMNDINTLFTERVYPIEKEFFMKNGYGMDFKKILNSIEEVRRQDCASHVLYNSCDDFAWNDDVACFYPKAPIHSIFRPIDKKLPGCSEIKR
jgi:hypothetical protein